VTPFFVLGLPFAFLPPGAGLCDFFLLSEDIDDEEEVEFVFSRDVRSLAFFCMPSEGVSGPLSPKVFPFYCFWFPGRAVFLIAKDVSSPPPPRRRRFLTRRIFSSCMSVPFSQAARLRTNVLPDVFRYSKGKVLRFLFLHTVLPSRCYAAMLSLFFPPPLIPAPPQPATIRRCRDRQG